MKHPTRILLIAAALSALITARAQSVPDVTTLSTYIVRDVPVENSINPLTRETDGVFGDARNPLATPRAYSTITAGLVNERGIHGLREILDYSPGAYAPSSYGELTVAYVRGDVAEAYVNGQRRSDNFYGYLPSFNGIEAVDLVRGPGSVVFGAGYLTGGYVNYVTKEPQFTALATTITTRLGSWVPGGGTFGNGSVQIDSTAAVSDKLAWRISYEGKAGDTYFKNAGVKDDREDLFAALTWKPREGVTFAFNGQWLWQDTPESLGVNRVTQELIWHGTYYTGASADGAYNPGPIPATAAVTLPRDALLYSRGDFAQAHVADAQLIATFRVSPELTLVNRTLYDHVNRHRFNQIGYIEYVTQNTFENRTEAHLDLSSSVLPQTLIAGATLRWNRVLGFENYANEYLYNFDITDPSHVFNQAAAFPSSYLAGAAGPGGREFFSPVDPVYPTPETGDSRVWNPAVFVQDEIKLSPQLSLLVGARGDVFSAQASDPLPPTGTAPMRASARADQLSGNASLLFRPSANASYYVTYQNVASLHGNLGGGGISLRPDDTIDGRDLRNRSDLLEAGAKYSFLANQLYAGAALFTQNRTRTSVGDVHDDIRIRGLELEAVYQPSTRLSATVNATLQDGRYLNAAPFQLGGRSIYDGFAAGQGPGGLGTATASYTPWSDQVPVGDWGLVGFSRVMLNASTRYRLENGFGAGLSAQWQSAQHGNLDNEWHIPGQALWNASVFYEHESGAATPSSPGASETRRGRRVPTWSVNLDFLNLADAHNWIHNGDAYTANQLVFPELPFRLEGYVKLKF